MVMGPEDLDDTTVKGLKEGRRVGRQVYHANITQLDQIVVGGTLVDKEDNLVTLQPYLYIQHP